MNLTKPQQLIYDMELFSGGAIATICGSVLINGILEEDLMIKSINEIIKINDALRIKIEENDKGVPTQNVIPYTHTDISILKFSNTDQLIEFAESLAKEPMDIHGDLFQIFGIYVGNKYGLLVKMHHIISDAWTISLIGTQFLSLINGEKINPSSYIDYIETEKKYLGSTRFEKDKAYWEDIFKKCNEPTYLSNMITKNTISDRLTFTIDEERTGIISEYVNKTSSSMYSALMTAVAVYFNRVKNNLEKFYIGTAVLNRSGHIEKNTMGMYINTVPVLIELKNDKTFEENMKYVTSSSLGVFRHQRFNYSDILKLVREEYSFNEKFYDVIFSYQNAKILGDETESIWYHCGSQNESLQIHIDDRDSDGVLTVHYDYNIEKFTKSAIERMHGHIFNLLFDEINNYNNQRRKEI